MERSRLVLAGIIGGILLFAFIGLILFRSPSGSAEEEEKAEPQVPALIDTVSQGKIVEEATIAGRLEALPNRSARLSAQIAGRILDLQAKRGDPIREGEQVVTIYNADLEADVRKAQAAEREATVQSQVAGIDVAYLREAQEAQRRQADALLLAAQARLDKLRAGNRPEEIAEAQAALSREQSDLEKLMRGNRPEEIDRAEAALRAAESELTKLKTGPRAQEIASAESALRDANAQLVAAAKEMERARTLFDDGLVSGKDKERAEANYAAAKAQQEKSQQALKLLREGTRIEEIRAQEEKVREAAATFRLAKAGFRPEEIAAQKARVEQARQNLLKMKAGPRKEEIREAHESVREANAKVAEVRAAHRKLDTARLNVLAAESKSRQSSAATSMALAVLGKSKIVSPVNGIVGRVFANVGEMVTEGAPLLEVINVEALRVMAEVPVSYLDRMKIGTQAIIRAENPSNRRLKATVTIIGVQANKDTGLVPIELWVSNADHRLKEGTPVQVTLRLRHLEDAVLVPSSAIFSRAGELYVYMVDEKNLAHERRIEVGAEQDGRTRVIRGLRPGERVVSDGTLSLADGAEIIPTR